MIGVGRLNSQITIKLYGCGYTGSVQHLGKRATRMHECARIVIERPGRHRFEGNVLLCAT